MPDGRVSITNTGIKEDGTQRSPHTTRCICVIRCFRLTVAACAHWQSRKSDCDNHRQHKLQAQSHVLLAIHSRLLDNSARTRAPRHVSVGRRRIAVPQIPVDTLPQRNNGRLPVQRSKRRCIVPGKMPQYTAFNRFQFDCELVGGKGIRHQQSHIPKTKHPTAAYIDGVYIFAHQPHIKNDATSTQR